MDTNYSKTNGSLVYSSDNIEERYKKLLELHSKNEAQCLMILSKYESKNNNKNNKKEVKKNIDKNKGKKDRKRVIKTVENPVENSVENLYKTYTEVYVFGRWVSLLKFCKSISWWTSQGFKLR